MSEWYTGPSAHISLRVVSHYGRLRVACRILRARYPADASVQVSEALNAFCEFTTYLGVPSCSVERDWNPEQMGRVTHATYISLRVLRPIGNKTYRALLSSKSISAHFLPSCLTPHD